MLDFFNLSACLVDFVLPKPRVDELGEACWNAGDVFTAHELLVVFGIEDSSQSDYEPLVVRRREFGRGAFW
jgi:hypothetical protein